MKLLLWIFLLAGNAATEDNGNYYVIQMPEEDPHRTLTKQFRVFWNVPTMQCKSKGIPFEHLFERYGILQNDKDSFRGEKISILYDPGLFPALLKNESTGEYKFRNGGVPQEGDIEKHMASFKSTLEQSIPDPHFSGVGIIDFESWRPIFRQNFGVLVPYKDVSYQIERKKHWIWPEPWIKAEAKRRFEEKARTFMQTTLSIAKQMRPKAQWGYYGFPYCFNMAASNMRERCADRVPAENDDIYWLWLESTALYPSVYSSSSLTTNQLAQLVRGRIQEAARVRKSGTPILPYFWFRYHSTDGGYLSEADLQTAIKTMYESDASGFILWGSSNDVNTVEKCKNLVQYIEKYLGPEVAKYTKYDRMQSMNDEVSTVVANDDDHQKYNSTVNTLPTTDRTLSSTVTLTTTDKSSNNNVTSSLTTDRSLSSTLSTLLTTSDELDIHEISKPANQSDLEYYDDDFEEQNKTTIKDVNFQLDSEYFWIRPDNYDHNIKKEVDNEMRRQSYNSNTELNDKTTTETAQSYISELDALLLNEAPKVRSQEDDLDKILIQSTTEDEFMGGLTTITETASTYDIENYESIDIMYDDVETNTKCNAKRLQDEKQDNIESQNERFGREFETYEVGSQFEDQLSEDDGSDVKIEKVPKIVAEGEREIVTSNIVDKEVEFYNGTERILNTVTEDGLIPVLPKIVGDNSNSILKNDMVQNDVYNESTTIISILDLFYLYANTKQVIPIKKAEGVGEGPPVLPLRPPEINRFIIKSISEPDFSNVNASKNKYEQTVTESDSVMETTEKMNTLVNVTEINDVISVNTGNDVTIRNESAFDDVKHLINATPATILIKNPTHIEYGNTKMNSNVEQSLTLHVNKESDNKITTNDNENKTAITTISTINNLDVIEETEISRTLKSKNEKKELLKTSTEVISPVSVSIGTTVENPEEWNAPILSDQVNVHFV